MLIFFFSEGRIRAITISNDDKYFATSANDTDVRLYETRTGSLVHLLSGKECLFAVTV